MKPKVKKVLSITVTAFFGTLVTLLLVLIGYFVISGINDTIPYVGNVAILRVATSSMETAIPQNSYILVERVDADDIKEGDVITFYSRDPMIKGYLNTHRVHDIIEVDGRREFVTKGDNNSSIDAYNVLDEDIQGRYVCRLDWITEISSFVLSPLGLVLVIAMPCTVMIALAIVDVLKKAAALKQSAAGGVTLTDEERIAKEVERLLSELKTPSSDDK